MKLARNSFGKKVTQKPNFENTTEIPSTLGKIKCHLQRFFSKEEPTEKKQSPIRMITVLTVSDAFFIAGLVGAGQIVLADYHLLKDSEQQAFVKNLAVSLMRQGTHFDRVGTGILVCGERGVIENKMEEHKQVKVYSLDKYRQGC